jgi:3-dehydroquinate synthase
MTTTRFETEVRLPALSRRSYTITIQPGLLRKLPEHLHERVRAGRVFIVTDSNVRRLYGRHLHHILLLHDIQSVLIDFPAGEASKNAGVAGLIYTALLEAGVRRDSMIVALGGGVVGDLAGFVAATVLRGIPFVQIPTTLLAQVDSSVGGKVGIDHPPGKNLVGAFHQPLGVYIDPAVLATLPGPEFRNGLAEIVKIAVALDLPFFKILEQKLGTLDRKDVMALSTIVARAVGLKSAVVGADEREAGLRKSLNLGHTIGHALEAGSEYSLSHGSAVSIGMAVEAEFSVRLGLSKPADARRIISVLTSCRLPVRVPRGINARTFYAAMAADKKSAAGEPRFVLPAGVGRCAIGVRVPSALIAEVTGIRL